MSRPSRARRETLVSERRVCIGKERRQFPKARTRPCVRRKPILSQGVKIPSCSRRPAMRPPSCRQFHPRALWSNPSKESDKSCAVCMSVCMRARLCVCTYVSSPLGEMPAVAPERLGMGKTDFALLHDERSTETGSSQHFGSWRWAGPLLRPPDAAGAILTCTQPRRAGYL